MLGFNPRDLRRILKRMGLTVEELEVEEARLVLRDGRELLVREPGSVALIKGKGQPSMIYIVGGELEEARREEETPKAPEFSEEDVALVAEQAGVSLEEARRALEESGGDIAAAILRLKGEGG